MEWWGDLAGLQEPEQVVANADGNGGLSQTRETQIRGSFLNGLIGQLLLFVQAIGTGTVVLGNQRTEGILVFLTALR